MNDLNNVFEQLDKVLSTSNIEDVTAEDDSFQDLPDGYYLCEVEKVELKESKTSYQPMAAFQFNITEDGLTLNDDAIQEVKKSKGRKIFMYFVIKDETSLKRFATNMLKFEGEVEGEPLLSKEYFTNSAVLADALDTLVGSRIYIHVSTSVSEDNNTSTWKNLISWKRAKALNLPM